MSALCCYCRDGLGNGTWTCPRCATTIHSECYQEHEQCPVYGCAVVRWRHVSKQERGLLIQLGELNGCGPKGGWIKPPDFLFIASCYHHDFNYWIGGNEADRLKADWEFYQAMIQDADRHGSWWNRWFYRAVAWTYYQAVRKFAGKFFHYGTKRTRRDLDELLARAA